MKKILLLVSLALAASGFAIEDTPENRAREADRYLVATPPKETFADMAEQVSRNIPPDQRDMFKAVLTKHLDLDALTKAMKGGMVKNFSADELRALADFYGSPLGKSAMKKFGVYMAELMPAIQTEMGKAMSKAAEERRAAAVAAAAAANAADASLGGAAAPASAPAASAPLLTVPNTEPKPKP